MAPDLDKISLLARHVQMNMNAVVLIVLEMCSLNVNNNNVKGSKLAPFT